MDVVIVDSGMGGLDVAARLYDRLREHQLPARLAFVNVRPPPGRRYEDVLEYDDKIAMLKDTLQSIADLLPMDLLAIACNSLSVLAPYTRFHARHEGRTLLICESGIHALCQGLGDRYVYVFGTELTIQSGQHVRHSWRAAYPRIGS